MTPSIQRVQQKKAMRSIVYGQNRCHSTTTFIRITDIAFVSPDVAGHSAFML